MKIALFPTCIADVTPLQAAQATVHLPEHLGHEVYFLEEQGCCGQVHTNTGYYPEAIPLTHNYADIFIPTLDGQWGATVTPSDSRMGSLRHQASLVTRDQGEPQLAVYAEALAKKTYDLPELLVNVLGMVGVDAHFPHRVTYHTTCHSLWMAHTGDTVTRPIAAVRGIDYMPLPDSDVCCDLGGISSLENPEASTAALSDKIANVISTGAEIVVAGDYSRLMNIDGDLARSGSGIRSMRLAEVPAETEESPWFVPATSTKVGA